MVCSQWWPYMLEVIAGGDGLCLSVVLVVVWAPNEDR